jgi:hypothetical protein
MLKSMLQENTGRHFLDSGGAYGRHWQRNQLKDFDASPYAWYEAWVGMYYGTNDPRLDLSVTVDAYHYLTERLDYAGEVDDHFRAWIDARNEGLEEDKYGFYGDDYLYPNLEGMKTYAEAFHDEDEGGWAGILTVNTYNDEDALSQTLQYVAFYHKEFGDWVYLLQVHGGCDVRGGYTDARAFYGNGHYGEDPYGLCDNADFTFYWEAPNPRKNQLRFDGVEEPDTLHVRWFWNHNREIDLDDWDLRDSWFTPLNLSEYPVVEEDEPRPDDFDTLVVVDKVVYLGPSPITV